MDPALGGALAAMQQEIDQLRSRLDALAPAARTDAASKLLTRGQLVLPTSTADLSLSQNPADGQPLVVHDNAGNTWLEIFDRRVSTGGGVRKVQLT